MHRGKALTPDETFDVATDAPQSRVASMITTFQSTLRAAFLVVLLATSGLGTAGQADEYVMCLQKQLEELGYNPGPLDGSWGPKTKSAANALREQDATLANIVALDNPRRISAISWCREIGAAHPKARKFRPSVQQANFYFDKSVTPIQQGLLRSASRQALYFLKSRYKIDFASRIDIVAGSDRTQLTQLTKTLARRTHMSSRGLAAYINSKCLPGRKPWFAAAYYDWIIV